MANYGVVINSTFKPFSYQELAMPLDRMEAYHEKLAEEYDKMSSQADVLEAMGANERDRKSGAYSRYKAYSDALRKEADDLYRNGLNFNSRQRLSDLRRRYSQEIVPIQNAWTKREQESAEQMKARLNNPHIMFTRDAQSTSLEDYIKNPTGGYGVINGANINAQMSAMAKNLADRVYSGGKREDIDDFTYNYIRDYGLDANLIRNWQNNPTLSRMFKQVMEANGITPEMLANSANGQDILNRSMGYAEMGMWDAMGKSETQKIEDYGARLAAQLEKEIALKQTEAALKNSGTGDVEMPNIPSIGVGLVPTEEYKASNLTALNSLKAGNNSFKASYFGKKVGDVNPVKIYEEYQKELEKRRPKGIDIKPTTYSPVSERNSMNADTTAAKKAVLDKYKKYGVTDIISKDQYNALKSIGYTGDSNFERNTRYSDLIKGFNKTVEHKSRYSTNMTSYDNFNDKALPNLRTREQYNTASGIWKIKENGTLGNPEKIKDLKLYDAENSKGNKITDVQYDPQFKGKIVIQLSDGTLHVADPSIYDSNLTNMIISAEAVGAHPQAITARIYDFLNKKNKVQSNTDSKVE